MNLQEQLHLSNERYGLLFDVRRSIRYHDRRKAFYERFHHVTSLLTILMAGSVLFDLAKEGDTADWLLALSAVAALLAALDMVIGYAKQANLHSSLRERFANLEVNMVTGPADGSVWEDYQRERLLIEKDEPAIYKVLNLLCYNELLESEGYTRKESPERFLSVNPFCRMTSQLLHWENVNIVHGI